MGFGAEKASARMWRLRSSDIGASALLFENAPSFKDSTGGKNHPAWTP
jgi:hypothetical protein